MRNDELTLVTRRELEVVACILIGEKTYKATGRLLNISPKTVETHLRRVVDKYNCRKADLVNILGYEKLQLIYLSCTRNAIECSKRKSNCSKLLTVSLFAIALSGVLIGSYYTLKKDNVPATNIIFDHQRCLLTRDILLNKIDHILNNQKGVRTVIISGVGGSGKTTLARSYICKKDAKLKWEIVATSEQDIEISFKKLARHLAKTQNKESIFQKIETLQDHDVRREEIIAFVAESLRSISDWVLLFDDVQNQTVVKKYIPTDYNLCGNGSVIITTKNSKLGENYQSLAHIKMPEISVEEQLDLFIKINSMYILNESEKKKIKTFLSEIPRLPLDSAIAAYYVKNTGSKLDDYIEYLKENSKEFYNVQHKIAIQSINYNKTRFGVIASDFSKIIKDNPEFKQLMLFVFMMNHENININWLKRLKLGVTVDSFIYELQKYSLAEISHGMCNIHRFTHQVGFHYVVTQFSKKELNKAIDQMINIVATGYTNVQKLSLTDRLNFAKHIESFLIRIDNLKLDSKQKYKLLLSNALLHCYMNFKSRNFVKEFAQNIIMQNNNELPEQDLIKLLEICGNYNLISQDYDKAERYISDCLRLCGRKSEFQHMKAICLLDLAVLSEMKGNLKDAKHQRQRAFEFVNFSKDKWTLNTKLDLFSRFYRYYKELFVHSKEFQQVIDLGTDILKNLSGDKFFYKENDYQGVDQEQLFSIRRYMIALYNKIGNFQEALENVHESEFFFNLIKKDGIPFINKEATFRMRAGYTFLRLNKLDEAEKVLKRCIQVHKEIGETPCISQALLYLTEVLIRLNKLDEAYECAKQAIKRMDKAASNNDSFFKATCHYFIALMEFRNKNNVKSMEHFNEFLIISQKICRNVLDDAIYSSLNELSVFEAVSSESELQKGFNFCAVKIFKNVYEPLHPFVTDFVCTYGTINTNYLK